MVCGLRRTPKANLLFDKTKREAVKQESKHLPLYLNQRTLFSHLFFGPYVILPLICALVWLGGLAALMGLWVRDGKPRYKVDGPRIAYVSHVGAVYHTLFICITAITGGTFIATMFAERYLRHMDRLPEDVRKREKWFDWLAVLCAIIGAVGLILLGVFDSFNHSKVHWSMTAIFIVFTAISAIFQSLEIFYLQRDHPDRQHLLRSAMVKLVVVVVAIILAIAFAACYGVCSGNSDTERCDNITSGAAALEWTVAFFLTFYFLSLILDLWPAGKTSPRYLRRLARWQEKHEPHNLEHDFTGRNAFATYPERWQGPDGRALPDDAPDVVAYPAPPTASAPVNTYAVDNNPQVPAYPPVTSYNEKAPNVAYPAPVANGNGTLPNGNGMLPNGNGAPLASPDHSMAHYPAPGQQDIHTTPRQPTTTTAPLPLDVTQPETSPRQTMSYGTAV